MVLLYLNLILVATDYSNELHKTVWVYRVTTLYFYEIWKNIKTKIQ